MRVLRTNIASLMGLTVLVAIALASLRKPSTIATGVLVTLAFGLNLLALVAVLLGEHRVRAGAIGFAICGWGYFWFSFLGPGSEHVWLISSCLVEVALDDPENQIQETFLLYRAADSLASIAFGAGGCLFAMLLKRNDPSLAGTSSFLGDHP